ncbi:MAG: hypothetical protein HKP61_16430 [Dactylosporangium sp.]|nr:hypothetical protein [Dactylosporangium sp.]NNJ62494.1 hypothetical protein [Dactylosporangium sp.]
MRHHPDGHGSSRGRRGVRHLSRIGQGLLAAVVFVSCLMTPYSLAPSGAPGVAFHLAVACVAAGATLVVRTSRWPLYLVAVAGWWGVAAWSPIMVASYATAVRTRSQPRLVAYGAIAAILTGAPLFLDPRGRGSFPMGSVVLLALGLVMVPVAVGSFVRTVRTWRAAPRGSAADAGAPDHAGTPAATTGTGPIRTVRRLRWLNRVTGGLVPWGIMIAVLADAASSSSRSAIIEIGSADEGPARLLVFAVITASVACTFLARRTLWPLYPVAALAWLAATMTVPAVVAAYYTATRSGRRLPVALFAGLAPPIAGGSLAVATALRGGPDPEGTFVVGVVFAGVALALPLAVGIWVRARREVAGYQVERIERLERERAALAETARSQERTRIAHEMHDVVAHRVSLMVLHAGALEVTASDPATVEAAALIRTTGREALTELRTVLGVLRPGAAREGTPGAPGTPDLAPPPTLEGLDDLLAEAGAAGLAVERIDRGEPRPVPVTVARTAYRVVQEALTNVIKHAGAAATTVILTTRPDQLEIIVENAPPRVDGQNLGLPGSGLGLIGLRERVTLAGGTLTTGPVPASSAAGGVPGGAGEAGQGDEAGTRMGFAVVARIPLAARYDGEPQDRAAPQEHLAPQEGQNSDPGTDR